MKVMAFYCKDKTAPHKWYVQSRSRVALEVPPPCPPTPLPNPPPSPPPPHLQHHTSPHFSAQYRGKLFDGVIAAKTVINEETLFDVDYSDGGKEELVKLENLRVWGNGLPVELCQ